MPLYTTTIMAVSPKTGKVTEYSGPHVPGISFADAKDYCEKNGLGYCRVSGRLLVEVPMVNGKPDWPNKIDYDTMTLN